MDQIKVPGGYRLVMESELKEIGLKGTVLEHEKSGARIICLPSEDENKVFYIGFRTPPVDDSGLPHILEHSVLCGSDKYPIKDPFMELAKSSLNTFLNAMTFPDKTIYPVASCNNKDFANLMDVYLDAVFNPLIHHNKNIFLQEGWRYELESPEGELGLNGVVYSEMKGAFSSAEDCLYRYAINSLYPDTAYGFESGGDPEFIPTLSYESFCQFHKKLYHPSNSYIFLYGNMDMEERLRYLDQAYLMHYKAQTIDSALGHQKPFESRRDLHYTYPLAEEEDASEKSFYSLQWVVGDNEDSLLTKAFEVLETVLLTAPGAPLKQALLDAGLAKDAGGGYIDYIRQPAFQLMAKEGKQGQEAEFLKVVTDCLKELAEKGLNPASLKAAISAREFRRREADFGGMSKGLIYGIDILQTWLHQGQDPFLSLRFEKDYEYLRDHIQEGYFEELIKKYLLNNTHCSLVVMDPEKGKAEKDAAALKEKLQAYKASLSEEAVEGLVKQCKELKAYQEEEDSFEARQSVPKLTKADIKRQARVADNHEDKAGPSKLIYRFNKTAGIAYVNLGFDLMNVPREHLPWLGLLRACFSVVSTEEHDYREIFDLISENTGGMSLGLETIQNLEGDQWKPYANLSVKALYTKWESAADLIREITLKSLFGDEKRLLEIVGENLIGLKQMMMMAGHRAAAGRASSYFSQPALFGEITGGIDFLRFLEDLSAHFEERKEEVARMLETVAKEVFTRDNMIINLTCEEEAFPAMQALLSKLAQIFPSDPEKRFSLEQPHRKNEGFKTTGGVGYVAHCGSFKEAGPYTGSLKVLQTILGTDYLWQNLRVLGGAYGAMCRFNLQGPSHFVSYRDPNIRSTEEAYQKIPAYIENLDLPAEVLDSFIISTIGGMDFPYTPSVLGSMDFVAYMTGITPEFQQAERDAVIDCSLETIHGLAPYVRAILKDNHFCTLGSGVKIEEEKDLFDHIENL